MKKFRKNVNASRGKVDSIIVLRAFEKLAKDLLTEPEKFSSNDWGGAQYSVEVYNNSILHILEMFEIITPNPSNYANYDNIQSKLKWVINKINEVINEMGVTDKEAEMLIKHWEQMKRISKMSEQEYRDYLNEYPY